MRGGSCHFLLFRGSQNWRGSKTCYTLEEGRGRNPKDQGLLPCTESKIRKVGYRQKSPGDSPEAGASDSRHKQLPLACLAEVWLQGWKVATCWITKHPWASLGALTRRGPIPRPASPVNTLLPEPMKRPALSLSAPAKTANQPRSAWTAPGNSHRGYVTSPTPRFLPARSPAPWMLNPRCQEAWGVHSTPWQAPATSTPREPTPNAPKSARKITCKQNNLSKQLWRPGKVTVNGARIVSRPHNTENKLPFQKSSLHSSCRKRVPLKSLLSEGEMKHLRSSCNPDSLHSLRPWQASSPIVLEAPETETSFNQKPPVCIR